MTDREQTWQTMTDRSGSGPRMLVIAFTTAHADVVRHDIRHPSFGPALQRATELLTQVALTGQGSTAKALCRELSPLARQISNAPSGSSIDVNDSSNLAALLILHLEGIFGWTDLDRMASNIMTETLLGRLARMTRFRDGQRETNMLAQLFHGRANTARGLAELGEVEDFFSAFLPPATAALHWPDWCDRFPARFAKSEVFWHQLFFAVRLLAGRRTDPTSWLLSQVGRG